MAKTPKPKKKHARELTSDETMDRLFGKDAHKTIRDVLEREDRDKGKRKPKADAE